MYLIIVLTLMLIFNGLLINLFMKVLSEVDTLDAKIEIAVASLFALTLIDVPVYLHMSYNKWMLF